MVYKQCHISYGIFITALMCILCFSGKAYGEELKNNFVLTGVHTDGFYLTSNNQKIFDAEGILPGDEIHAVIEAKNTTEEPLDLALLSIDSLMYDTSLFDALELTIKHDEEVVYNGAFHTNAASLTDYITVDAGKQITLDVAVSVPRELDNAYQGKKMESVWVFEAKHSGGKVIEHDTSNDNNTNTDQSVSPGDKDNQSGIKTGAELPGCGSNYIVFIVLGVIFIVLGLFLILKLEKKKTE